MSANSHSLVVTAYKLNLDEYPWNQKTLFFYGGQKQVPVLLGSEIKCSFDEVICLSYIHLSRFYCFETNIFVHNPKSRLVRYRCSASVKNLSQQVYADKDDLISDTFPTLIRQSSTLYRVNSIKRTPKIKVVSGFSIIHSAKD